MTQLFYSPLCPPPERQEHYDAQIAWHGTVWTSFMPLPTMVQMLLELEEEANREERARYMLAQVSPKQITDFLVKQMLDEPSTIGMFASEFGLCNSTPMHA